MKTSTYKKTDKGIEKISNDFDKLEVNDNQTVLLSKYQTLFNKIDKGSKVLSFVRTSENKDSLMDCLQNVMVKILAEKNLNDIDDISKYFNKMFSDRYKDYIRVESRYDIFKTDNLEHVIESKESGITKEYINQCLIEIKAILSISEYNLFKLYHIKGYKQKEIAIKLNTNDFNINRQIKALNNKLDNLKIAYLYDNRYVSHNTGKKKRSHKRSVLTQKQVIELSGKPYKIDKDNYQESIPLKSIPLDTSKLPYSKGHGMKDIIIDKSSYMVIYNGNAIYQEKKIVIQNVYDKSIVLDIPVKKYSAKEYRRKRYVRKYRRSLKVVQAYKNEPLTNGYKCHLDI